ncbi:hypothetical protein DIPPA_18169 [Diplonema papillatum]|nr:hypothetical protein DIPPA_18169 [Diplonema papillatum]
MSRVKSQPAMPRVHSRTREARRRAQVAEEHAQRRRRQRLRAGGQRQEEGAQAKSSTVSAHRRQPHRPTAAQAAHRT